MCILTQGGLCALDVAGASFPEALQRVRRAEMNAYKHAYFDHDDMGDLTARISRERGVDLDIAFHYNDRRAQSPQQQIPPQEAAVAPMPLQSADILAPGMFTWVGSQDAPAFKPLFIHVDEVSDAIQLILHLDTRYVSPADAEELARGMESAAVAAAVPALLRA